MIDFHNHILPNVDDGSKSLEMSLNMLRLAEEQGITEVVNTVHYQHPKVENEDISFKRINGEIQKLQQELDKNRIKVKLHIGAEVFFLPNLMEIKNDPLTTFNGSNYMLIEFLTYNLPDSHEQQFYNLKMAGITPIIAHPERYKFVQNDLNNVVRWLELGCLIMVDAGSVLKQFGDECFLAAESIIKNQWCHILGSDAHNDGRRNFCLKDSFNIVKNWLGDDAYPLVYDNPRAVISGEKIEIDFEYVSENTSNLIGRIKEMIGF